MTPNPRLLQTAKRWMNDEVPEERTEEKKRKTSILDPKDFTYRFLEGDEGRDVLAEYNSKVNSNYRGVSALNVLSFEDNVVKGSNPFAFVLLNRILESRDLSVATPADLERVLKEGILDLKGTYGDSALVLRSESEPNSYLAKDLIQQIGKKGIQVNYPLMIPLDGLELMYDGNSPCNLSFELTRDSQLIYAPQFDNKNNELKFNEGDENGLPIFKQKGKRVLYTGEGGLRRLYRGRDLYLGARDWYLANSNADGRVVVRGVATRAEKSK